ncbi:MAG: hypothetical protein H6645_12500 [Caldilineaceae bacterium]|nr:hypothetical protein [Caldilineaceae bacterium]
MKDAQPNSGESFSFVGTSSLGPFTLVDDGVNPNSRTFSNLAPGTYSVTELSGTPPGWTITSISCDDNNSTTTSTRADIKLSAGETVTCTFVNTKDQPTATPTATATEAPTNTPEPTATATNTTTNTPEPTATATAVATTTPQATPTMAPTTVPSQGCTPGYWKQRQHLGSWTATGYAPSQKLETVFSNTDNLGTKSLLQALSFKGGSSLNSAKQILLRAAVAALLSAAHPNVDYVLTTDQVIAQVNSALASNDRSTILALAAQLDAYNNAGCPLGRASAASEDEGEGDSSDSFSGFIYLPMIVHE